MYFAKTQGLKYDMMVISKTKDGAWKQLEKWWNKTWAWEDGEKNFKDAIEWYGFYVSDKIELDKEFDIQ